MGSDSAYGEPFYGAPSDEIATLRERLAAAERRAEKAALALARAHEVIALQRNEIDPEKYPEIDAAAHDVLDPCDEMADKLDKALADLDLAQKALRASETNRKTAEHRAEEAEALAEGWKCRATVAEAHSDKWLTALASERAAREKAERERDEWKANAILHGGNFEREALAHNVTRSSLSRAVEALGSIAANGCCDRCQEAALVARAVLAEVGK